MSAAELAGVILGSTFAAVVWLDYRTEHAQATIRRTVDQHHQARDGRR